MKKRKSYTPEFKRDTIRLLETTNKSVSELARDLGIRRSQLYKWKEQFTQQGKAAFPIRNRSTASMDEVTRLKLELEQLREENATLKKTVAYFVKEME